MEKFEIKKDCFAFRDRKGTFECNALNKLYCEKENCKFYKKCSEYNTKK